jgi:hypothetical protein
MDVAIPGLLRTHSHGDPKCPSGQAGDDPRPEQRSELSAAFLCLDPYIHSVAPICTGACSLQPFPCTGHPSVLRPLLLPLTLAPSHHTRPLRHCTPWGSRSAPAASSCSSGCAAPRRCRQPRPLLTSAPLCSLASCWGTSASSCQQALAMHLECLRGQTLRAAWRLGFIAWRWQLKCAPPHQFMHADLWTTLAPMECLTLAGGR